MRFPSYTARRRPRWGASIPALALVVSLAGCDELLEVSNPNNIAGDDVLKLAAANGLVHGALSGVQRGFGNILNSYSTATDELQWVGSRDAYRELDRGDLHNPFNEFVDGQFPSVAQGNWMAREAVRILTIHDESDSMLTDRANLGWAHLYLAFSYASIGDMFDDFAFSDRQEAAAPLGQANMSTVYNLAITSLGTAISIGQAEGDADLVKYAMGLRASVNFRLAVWNKVGTRPINTSDGGLVSSAAAVSDANAALALMIADDMYSFVYSSSTVTAGVGGQVNSRQEMRIGPTYATPDPSAPTWTAVTFPDWIDNTAVHPYLDNFIAEFAAAIDEPTLHVVTAREMHLILAENALASPTDMAAFTTAINNLRALDGLTDFSGQVDATLLLINQRQTNLFLQGRRLSDHYRFGVPSAEWVPGSTALTAPGTFLPITIIECRANENIPATCS